MSRRKAWQVTAVAALAALAAMALWQSVLHTPPPALLPVLRSIPTQTPGRLKATPATFSRAGSNLVVTSARNAAELAANECTARSVAGPGDLWQHQQHQDRVIAETAIFRPNVSGLFLQFFEHWKQQRAEGVNMGGCTLFCLPFWSLS